MKRPALWLIIYYIIGLGIGRYIDRGYLVMVCMSVVALSSIYLYKVYHLKPLLLLPVVCLLAYVNLHWHMQVYDYPADDMFDYSVEGRMVGVIGDMSIEGGEGYLILQVEELTVRNKTYKETVTIKAYGNKLENLHIGDHIQVVGKINKLFPPVNPGGFHEKLFYGIRGIHYTGYIKNYVHVVTNRHNSVQPFYVAKRFLYNIRQQAIEVYESILPAKQGYLMKAMVLGDKSGLDLTMKEQYARAGISHILAISGLHVAIIGYSLFSLMCYVMNKKKALWIIVIFLLSYCMLTGGSVSTIRASLMLIVGLMAYFFGRSYDIASSLAVVALTLLINNPLYIWDVGFLLSFSSVIGIVTIVPVLDEWYNKKHNVVVSLMNVSVGATLGTLPVIVYCYYEFQLYGVLVNILVVPLMSIVVLVGFIALIIGAMSLVLGKFCIGIVYYILALYEYVTELVGRLPYHTITIGRPAFIYMVLLILFIILIMLRNNKHLTLALWNRWMKGLITMFMLITIGFMLQSNPLEITHLAIGQGDSTIIISPSNHVFIVDGGGNRSIKPKKQDTGYYIIKPYLKYKGIDRIDGLVMTHSDMDHVGGLIELMDYFPVNKLFIPYGYKYKKEEDPLLFSLLSKAEEKQVSVSYIQEGDTIEVGKVTLETLYPSDHRGRYKSNNAYSTVVKVEYGEFRSLLTGDIEQEEEKLLSKKVADRLQSDIIKVPHHGSKTSSTEEFLRYVVPEVAVISCGQDNAYGHPHEEVVDRYNSYGITVYNTAVDGAVIMKTDGKSTGIRTYYTKREDYYTK